MGDGSLQFFSKNTSNSGVITRIDIGTGDKTNFDFSGVDQFTIDNDDSDAKVGINKSSAPTEALDVDGNGKFTGDIEITDDTKGIILTSPDTSRFRITVDNTGTLIVTAL